MSSDREIRVSDQDRQAAAERLRAAHDEGRLDLSEYDRRLAEAYSSVTYGDLDTLFLDLPASGSVEVARVRPRRQRGAPQRWVPADPAVVAAMPTALKVLWTIWASVTAINLTVWLLVGLGNGPVYFWPMWLAVPGVALFVVSAAIAAGRGGRPGPPAS